MTKENALLIRAALKEDTARIMQLEKDVWGEHGASSTNILARIETFPSGNPVAIYNNAIVGYGTGMIVPELPQLGDTWYTITDGGTTRNHDPAGSVFYGVSATAAGGYSVDIFSSIFAHGINLAKQNNCRKFALGSRMPGYDKWLKQHSGSAEEYINQRHRSGRSIDPLVSLYQQAGLKIQQVLPDYFPCEDSHDYGVLMTMEL